MDIINTSFLEENEYLYMTPQGLQKFGQIYDPQEPLKHILWTDDYKVELPIKMKKSGHGSEAPLTMIDILDLSRKKFKEHSALQVKREGKYVGWTYEQFYNDVQRFAKGLAELNVQIGKALNIIGFNSPEWMIAFYGGIYASVLPIGVYTTNGPDACHYIAEHSEAEVVLAENKQQLQKYLEVWDRLPQLKYIILYAEAVPSNLPSQFKDKVLTFSKLLEIGDSYKSSGYENSLEHRMSLQTPGKCCTLVYTSGTTGPPKGVMLSHDNYIWTSYQVLSTIKVDPSIQEKVVSYLPLSHVASQITDLIGPVILGAQVTFADSAALQGSLVEYLRDVRPTGFLAVPRVWEKIEERIKSVAAKNGSVKKSIGTWAKDLGKRGTVSEIRGEETPFGFGLAKTLIFNNIKKTIGLDQAKYCLYGAAPLSLQSREYFLSLNIFLANCYGMSESAGPTTWQYWHDKTYRHNLQSAGQALLGTKIIINNPDQFGEGEICYRGRNCFMGYFKNGSETKTTLDSKGYVHSGDLGKLDEHQNLVITGRIKELIITAGGENVAPVPIEDKVKEAVPFISNVVAIGDKMKYLVALVTLKHVDVGGQPTEELSEVTTEYLKTLGVTDFKNKKALYSNSAVVKAIQEGIDKANNAAVSRAAQIRKWSLIDGDLSVAGGELTPTLKLKRKVVHQKYHDVIEKMYLDPKL